MLNCVWILLIISSISNKYLFLFFSVFFSSVFLFYSLILALLFYFIYIWNYLCCILLFFKLHERFIPKYLAFFYFLLNSVRILKTICSIINYHFKNFFFFFISRTIYISYYFLLLSSSGILVIVCWIVYGF